MEHPLESAEDIALRRQMREQLVSAPDTSRALRGSLSHMETGWKSICWCWNDELSKTELVEGLLFTGMLAPLNDMPMVVNVYHFMRVCGTPLFHCLAPLVPVLLSYGALRWMGSGMSLKECWDMSTGVFKNALWFDNESQAQAPLFSAMAQAGGGRRGGGGELGGLSTMMNSINFIVPKIMKSLKWVWWAVFLMNIIMMIHQCYRHYKLLAHVYRRTHEACSWIRLARHMARSSTSVQNNTQHVLEHLSNWAQNSANEYSLMTSVFDFLNAYMLLRQPDVQKECKTLLRQVGVMDALQSVDTLLQRESFTVPEIAKATDTDEYNTSKTNHTQHNSTNEDENVETFTETDSSKETGTETNTETPETSKFKDAESNNDVDDDDEKTVVDSATDEVDNKAQDKDDKDDKDKELNRNSNTTVDKVVSKHHPVLELEDAYHPLLDTSQTKHTLSLQKHIVLTGSNASGKSTVLKTMLLNVLLAQSWGVVCAKRMKWTPFANIRGYLHTVDDCGKESLFQAQIRRIEEFIQQAQEQERLQQTMKNTPMYSLLVVDEILNSTNPIEAMLLSYQYARTIGSELSNTSRMVMTTHYPVLTTLADHHPEFSNWAMQKEYQIGVNKKCKASSAIGTVKKMTKVLGEKEHACLEKAYKRMFKKLAKMRFKELDGDEYIKQECLNELKTNIKTSPTTENIKQPEEDVSTEPIQHTTTETNIDA